MGLFLKENTHWDDMLTDYRVVKLDGFLFFYLFKITVNLIVEL